MRDDNDWSSLLNTQLSPQEEQQFQTWAKARNRLGDVYDYDIRGAWKANAQEASNGHLPDTYKKPNHPTFSTDSIYNQVAIDHGAGGGRWVQAGNKWQFFTGPSNTLYRDPNDLKGYFSKYEPEAQLILTPPAR